MKEEKFCKDCKHSKLMLVDNESVLCCDRIKDKVDGEPEYTCHGQRNMGFIAATLYGLCGKSGRFYEQKEEQNNL